MSLALVNDTPFSAAAFEQLNVAGDLALVVALRGTFDIAAGQTLSASPDQQPFAWSDEYDGDPQAGLLLRQADFIPYKPGTDVTVRGRTFAPGGRPIAGWPAGVRVIDASGAVRVQKAVRVHAPRYWVRETAPVPTNWRGDRKSVV